MLRVINLDMDGVVADCARATYARVLPPALVEEAYLLTTTWDSMHTAIGTLLGQHWTERDLYQVWKAGGEEFWATLPWTPEGQDVYALCRELAPTVMMSTPTVEPSSAAGKLLWIQRNLPQDQHRMYALAPHKHLHAHSAALLVDDRELNCEEFVAAGGHAFLWPQPWNSRGQAGVTPSHALRLLKAKVRRLLNS